MTFPVSNYSLVPAGLAAARDIAALAEAAAVIAGPSDGDPSGCPDQTP